MTMYNCMGPYKYSKRIKMSHLQNIAFVWVYENPINILFTNVLTLQFYTQKCKWPWCVYTILVKLFLCHAHQPRLVYSCVLKTALLPLQPYHQTSNEAMT